MGRMKVVEAPEVEVRYVIPLTGVAQRKGVLRLRPWLREHRHHERRGSAITDTIE